MAYDSCHRVLNFYDADDRLVQTTNGRGDTVNYTYDGTDPVSGASQKGLLSSKTDGNGHVTRYSYTARNEPAATYYPDGTSESVTYDENGNTKTRTKADGKVITYTYDNDNRLTDITYPTLAPTHFGYDADSRRTLMTDATGTTTWTYGDGLHLTQVTTPQGTLSYVPDGDGRRYSMSATPTGQSSLGLWTYGYDQGGRLVGLSSPTDGTTTWIYGASDPGYRLTQKTKGNGEYETYAYDSASQLTGIGYWWGDGTYRNGLTYAYDPAGNVSVYNQGFYASMYGYDGADQQTSENSSGTYPPPSLAYTYDQNGNRLTQTSSGSLVQSFAYDGHDKLLYGVGAISESEQYDANGSLKVINLSNGAYAYSYDEEDRLVSVSKGSLTDTFVYNGLGLRVGKTDSTGTYTYLCDGTAPGAAVLADGHAAYNPGLSENRAGTTAYYDFDRLGNLWTLDGANKTQLYYQDTTGFGSTFSLGGTSATPFKFGGGNGCQTDGDFGLVLMGHRYYDTRIGRFISQDPAGDGDNWYAYADNSPINEIDPSGLSIIFDPSKEGDQWQSGWKNANPDYFNGVDGIYDVYQGNGHGGFVYAGTDFIGSSFTDFLDSIPQNNPAGAPSAGGGMIAQPGRAPGMPPLSAYKAALKQLQAKYGRIPKVRGQKGKFSSRVRISGKRRYRLDPGHPHATDVREKGIHFNYEDYTNGKSSTGRAVEDVFQVEGGEGIMAEDIDAAGSFIGSTGAAEATGGAAAAEGVSAVEVIEFIAGLLLL